MSRKATLAFAALCLLSGSLWMLDEISPSIFAGPAQVAVHDGLLAGLFGLLGLRFGSRQRLSGKLIFELMLAGVALIGIPAIVSTGSAGRVSSLDGVLAFCLVPAFVVFLCAQRSSRFGMDESPLRALVPALLGLGGAALILPFTLPKTVAGDVWLLAIVLSAALSAWTAVRLHRLIENANPWRALAILCASAAVSGALFYRFGAFPAPPPDARQLLIEAARLLLGAPALLLMIYLLRELDPIAFSTRFLLIPLVTIVESYLIERPQTAWTTFAGAVLMAAAAFLLLRSEEPGDTQHGSGITL